MKRIFFALILLFSLFGNAQVLIGSTFEEIKKEHPDKSFLVNYTASGIKHAFTDMTYGTFCYYFNKETGLCYYCRQIPKDMTALNAQVEIYNRKYVIVSQTSWKAYLDGGAIIDIDLVFDEESKSSHFTYQ